MTDSTKSTEPMQSLKPDCFGYRLGRCMILTEMVCLERNCPFYKTVEQDKDDREKYRPKLND